MATPAVKIDSNVTGLRYAKESAVLGTLPGSPIWVPMEPNSYSGGFGGNIKTVARNPINPSRQRKKGVTTDLDAAGGLISDITQTNLQELLTGLFFAAFRRKPEYGVDPAQDFSGIATSDDSYNAATGLAAFVPLSLVFASGFTNAANNGLKNVATVAAGKITVTQNLVDETPAAGVGSLVSVGYQFASGTLNVDISGTWPKLLRASGAVDFTTLGLTPGEMIYVGGDTVGKKFVNALNAGFCRVRSVAATYIELDKTAFTMAAETGTGLTVQIFYGRVLKNELGTNIVRSSFQLERTLGAADLDQPTQIQAEYIVGAVPNTAKLQVPTADKVTFDLAFVGIDSQTRDGVTGVKTGSRPALVESDAFNTSSDVSKIKLAPVVSGNANPSPLFSYIQDLNIDFNNNIAPNKAVGVLGAFDLSTGTFAVSGDLKAYFSDVAAIAAVRANTDITFESHFAKANSGFSLDLPLVTLGNGQPEVAQDTAVLIPLNLDAATGAKVDPNKDHTALMVFFDYLPSAAEA